MDSTVRRSRRAVLGAALGGAAALAASNVAKPLSVKAADGDTALVGENNTSTTATRFMNTNAGETALGGLGAASGTGVEGESATGIGLHGQSTSSVATEDWEVESHKTAVFGATGAISNLPTNTDETGVFGFADVSFNSVGVGGYSVSGLGVYGIGGWSGVYGSGNITGVLGDVGTGGTGVYGFTGSTNAPAPPAGVGVYARAATTSQTALQVAGKVKFSRSGRVAISEGSTSKLVSMAGVTDTSYVIATLQTSASGLYVRAVVPASGQFRIYLSKAAPKRVVVGYLVVN